ncbi:NAD(P)H-dependent oxidoreductase [Paracoccus sp. IB05]|uniref:NAD(P)H-dependent oxidoreductase n=1 Tax=Paracoccus sp. IB05 TaxID=2779367 RepID=UPI0018E8A543|nr:NAD(P)H-dependent oxidoreductase [Paracoccus sp. IB05]MBJ2149552.1 NAD(P)H-dependent oxidoreductase [Paracoccus sp. IB05]
MSELHIVGLAGNITAPSKTRALVGQALDLAGAGLHARTTLFDIADFGEDLGRARRADDLSPQARQNLDTLLNADALIVATPIYKGSYPGLFKHLIDLIDPAALLRKPVLIAATGGGEKHALAVEHQLRPLFAFFEARVLSTAVHVSDRDFSEGQLVSDPALNRLARAIDEFTTIFPAAARIRAAAE